MALIDDDYSNEHNPILKVALDFDMPTLAGDCDELAIELTDQIRSIELQIEESKATGISADGWDGGPDYWAWRRRALNGIAIRRLRINMLKEAAGGGLTELRYRLEDLEQDLIDLKEDAPQKVIVQDETETIKEFKTRLRKKNKYAKRLEATLFSRNQEIKELNLLLSSGNKRILFEGLKDMKDEILRDREVKNEVLVEEFKRKMMIETERHTELTCRKLPDHPRSVQRFKELKKREEKLFRVIEVETKRVRQLKTWKHFVAKIYIEFPETQAFIDKHSDSIARIVENIDQHRECDLSQLDIYLEPNA